MKTNISRQFRCLSLAGALAALAIAAPAGAGVFDAPGGVQVSRDMAAAQPMNAGGSSAITPLSARGTAALNFTTSKTGACPDSAVACNASSGHCECDIFNGVVTLPKIGKGNLTLNLTTDDDDGGPNGTGSCFPGTGHGTICNGGSCLGLFVEGQLCTGILSEPDPSNGVVVVDANEVFYIDPATSTGKAAGASGGGNLAIANAVTVVNSKIASSTGYATLNGAFQAKP